MATRIDEGRNHIEYFKSLPEMYGTLRKREPVYYPTAFLYDEGGCYKTPRKSFYGFDNVEDLKRQIVGGSTDTKFVKDVHAFAGNLKCGTLKVRQREPSFITGQFRMDKYLNNDPLCFDRTKKVKKPNKVLKLLINMSVHCGIDVKDLENACKVVARNVVSLEKAGYRVRLTACACQNFTHAGTTHTVAVDLKDEGHCINYRKLCFGMSAMMFRGAIFSWISCEPRCRDGLGMPVSNEEIAGEQLAKVINPNGVWYASISDVMDIVQENGNDLYKASDALCERITEALA